MQLLIMTVMEVCLFAVNEYVGALEWKAVDMGGSMFVHTFGAYFGLAVSLMLEKRPAAMRDVVHPNNGSRYDSDVSAMIGTLVLWILWPSFNGALAPNSDAQIRVVVNTVLALTASCTWSFLVSHVTCKGKFDMVHVQNATLAGGVAMGSASDLIVGPGGAMVIGSIAGTLSVIGYVYISPMLLDKIGLQDTCGVHNLHGMPGILGGVTGLITVAVASEDVYGLSFASYFGGRSPADQWPYQLWALLLTLGIAIAGGALTGFLMNKLAPGPKLPYQDQEYWTTEAPTRELAISPKLSAQKVSADAVPPMEEHPASNP